MSDPSLVDYYAKRACEYDRLYEKPERQADLKTLRGICAQALAGQRVLEIACGTGYWTQAAKSIVATDINSKTLQIARTKPYSCPVSFQEADAFNLDTLGTHDATAGMAMAWWSHLRQSEISQFLAGYHRQFRPGAALVFLDNRFVPGSSTPVSRRDDEGNTYQLRRLEDGTEQEVLKNFPSASEVKNALAGCATEIRWTQLSYYWFLSYRLG